jgi:predicted small secreted protein
LGGRGLLEAWGYQSMMGKITLAISWVYIDPKPYTFNMGCLLYANYISHSISKRKKKQYEFLISGMKEALLKTI